MNRLIFSFLIFSVLTSIARADQPPLDRDVFRSYCDVTPAPDINQCTANEMSDAQRELNDTYQAALKYWADSKLTIQKLQASQKLWIELRASDMAARFAYIEEGKAKGIPLGSGYASIANQYESSLDRNRTAQLCEFVRGNGIEVEWRKPCAELTHQILAGTRKNPQYP